jgi:ABC-type transport system substrate-binding protein
MDVTTPGRASTGAALLAGLGVLTGCGGTAAGGSSTAPPAVTVQTGGDAVTLDPTQYCVDGDGQRYSTSPPILEVTPDTTIELAVPDAVAEAGWSVQVYDEQLEEMLGEVDVPEGAAEFDEITSSDVVPPTFYLVVVERADPEACSGLSGAWPVGFIRKDGPLESTSPTPSG